MEQADGQGLGDVLGRRGRVHLRWDVVPRDDVREPGFSVSAVVAQEGKVAGGAEAESIELGGDGGKGVDKVEIVAEWGG